jgi:hypothetical protein
MEETSTFHKLIYQKKAALTEADARDFSTKDYTCVKLLLTKRGRTVRGDPRKQRYQELALAGPVRLFHGGLSDLCRGYVVLS